MTPSTTTLRFRLEDVEEADDCNEGFCLACGATRESCEPDAEGYRCYECEEMAVYGPHWIAIAGLIE